MTSIKSGTTLCITTLCGLFVSVAMLHPFLQKVLADENPPQSDAGADKVESVTHQLLRKLKEQNAGPILFTDPWWHTLQELVDQGPVAVPELIEELDATHDARMVRCLGFILRAINDKRAVPALIRAIPKTLFTGSSDMGLNIDDPMLAKFAQEHQLDPQSSSKDYTFGRPVREISAALEKLTSVNHGNEELFHIFLVGTEYQRQRQRDFFSRKAETWADWWEKNWASHVDDPKYAKVGLPVRNREDVVSPTQLDVSFKTVGRNSNWILESVLNPSAKIVFYDFDVGRAGALPEKWRHSEDISAHLNEITIWAIGEGFDLMGTEYRTANGRNVFVLRSLRMQIWQLPDERWKMTFRDITLQTLQDEGKVAAKPLLYYDKSIDSPDPDKTASYFFITRHGTPGLLFVGIEVQDDSLKPGGQFDGDDELNPIAFYKGRRFAFSLFEEFLPK